MNRVQFHADNRVALPVWEESFPRENSLSIFFFPAAKLEIGDHAPRGEVRSSSRDVFRPQPHAAPRNEARY